MRLYSALQGISPYRWKKACPLKDLMEREADAELKKTFITAGAACRSAVALTSIAKAVKVWALNVESALGYLVQEELFLSNPQGWKWLVSS